MKKNIIIAASLAAFILSGAAAISSSAYAADFRPPQQAFQAFGPGPKDPPHLKKDPPKKDPPHMKKAHPKKAPPKKAPPRKDPKDHPPMPPRR